MEQNFSLSWDSYQKSICNGLSALQQNGELVDMTLAADGHHVKVHQLVMSLVSPYIKELIASAQCPHPVIFLNDVSHKTLTSILEYIYTGEVCVNKENLCDVMKAAKALKINGLMDIVNFDYSTFLEDEQITNIENKTIRIKGTTNDNDKNDKDNSHIFDQNDDNEYTDIPRDDPIDNNTCNYEDISYIDDNMNMDGNLSEDAKQPSQSGIKNMKLTLQYTASNRGNIQMILNRFMYHLRYSGKNNHRRWQCVDHETPRRCNAAIVSLGDTLVKRLGVHNHPFHDKKILRKTQTSAIYTTINDVESVKTNT